MSEVQPRFNVGDIVQISFGGVWIVQNVIVTPPPRWEENGVSKVSYCLFSSVSGGGQIDSVDEDEISLLPNPLITQEQAFARINRNADGTHRYAGMTASEIEEAFRNEHPERFVSNS
jgi:hypothetical protein